MSDEAVRKFLREGFAFPCACCKRLWRAKAQGFDTCEVAFMPGKDCGGPMAGMSFPMYEGPLTISSLATMCFRCGNPAVEAVSSRQQPTRLIGACKKHVPTLDRLVPMGEDPRKVAG
jgi:hypothetical protein